MPDVIIIGAGLAGLACARRLLEIGRSFLIVEADDAVGGRVRTDVVAGFRLDRGFQVLLTAYPECQRHFDYDSLRLGKFQRGALIRFGGAFHRLADPRYDPVRGIAAMFGPIGTIGDKWKLLSLESKLKSVSVEQLFEQPEGLTLDLLRWHGFTESMVERFFRPFFGGVFLEKDLVTSSRMFRFVFRMFADGDAALPADGMQALPDQLASRLPDECIRLRSPVAAVGPGKVTLQNGEVLSAKSVVVATDAPAACRLLGWAPPYTPRSVTCLYFAAAASPTSEPILVLNADETGPVHNVAVVSDVSDKYAPAGQALVSVTVLGVPSTDDAALEAEVRQQLTGWYGADVAGWKHLRTYRIRFALPDQTAPALDPAQRPVRLQSGLFVCGDHRDNASINGALQSGWRAAQAVAEELRSAGVPSQWGP